MSNEHDVTVQNKSWSPRMVKLTSIGNHEVNGGKPTATYVDPYCVALAVRSIGAWSVQIEGSEQNPRVECTIVWLRGGGTANILVVETPEEVALLRDRALEVPVTLTPVA